jgi:hypothetical protein
MSFKLFIATTFGLIKPTAKLETANEVLLADYQMFCEFEKSAELKEYNELDLLLKSPTFLQRKREIQHLVLKGSKEEAQLAEFNKLNKNSRLQKFYDMLESDELKRFEKISASAELATYKKFKSMVHNPSFDANKKKDEKSDEFAKNAEYHKLKNSETIRFYEHFAKSKEYKNYVTLQDSAERKRYEELKKITGSTAFKARVTYLDDKHKWEKTDEHARELRFAELKKKPQLITYLRYQNSTAFDFFKKWELVFDDQFKSGKLDREHWMTLSHGANHSLGRNFSQVGDLHAFTEGRNVSVEFNVLKIEVRKEKTHGMQWHMPFGFVEKEFNYSSGLVSTAGVEWWKYGILEAKVKYAPSTNLADVIYLLGDETSPQINLVEMGVKNRVGLLTKNADGIQADCESISGLKVGEFYIFRLEWSSHSLIWKINGREILTLTHHVPAFKMHLNIASIVVAEPADLPHHFEIDWVRFYQRRPKN